jgi:hypothetical protein
MSEVTKPTSEFTKPPAIPRADAIPTDGYVLSIDGKLKARYETAKEAMTAGSQLKQNFPVIQVEIFNAAERTYTPVEGQEKQASSALPS